MIESSEKRSFEFIDYLLRPKKQIQRKIIIEILQELDKEVDLRKYLYIGFGSIHYYDFILFHKFLKLNNLLSIDDKSTKKRFEYNRPYDFISFENKVSTDYLREFDWKKNVVIWLDSDKKLNDRMLADLKIIANNCKETDVLMITISASYGRDWNYRKKNWKTFCSDFGTYIAPEYKDEKFFAPKHLTKLLQHVIINYLKTACELRDIMFYKLFSFEYQDGSPMFTLGGIFHKKGSSLNKTWDCEFICTGEEITNIDVPILTHREKFCIDSHIMYLKQKILEIETEIDTRYSDPSEKELRKTEMINSCLPFEVPSFYGLKKYISYYKYYPQYYEGII